MQDFLHQIKHFLELQQDTYGNIRFRPKNTVAALTSNEQIAVRTQDVQDMVEERQKSLSAREEKGPDVPPLEIREEERNLVAAPVSEKLVRSLSGTPFERIHDLISPDHPIYGMGDLDSLEKYVADTRLIPIDETRTKPVFGVGNPVADLMVIGEAPGRDEDLKGEPFVGKAGQLLDKILQAIGFTRSDVYIANILKSRPPGNRNPEPDEIEKHIPILFKQITLIRPRIILCLGKVSAGTLLGSEESLSRMRKTDHDFYGIPLMVTYHPAALLRNPQWKRPTWEDVQQLRARYDQLVAA